MNILFIGLGSIAKKHIDAILEIDKSCIIYVLRTLKGSEIFPGTLNIYSTEEVQNANPDCIVVTNPTHLHLQSVKRFLILKKPIFVEKPVFNSTEVQDTINQIKKNGIMTYVGCNLRFLDALKFLKDNIKQAGRINEVNIYCGSYLPEWRPNQDYRCSYSSKRDEGGGAHLDLIHELDYMFWIFGNPLKVQSQFNSCSSLDIDAVDSANYWINYPKYQINISLNYYRRDTKRTCEILFEDDTWIIDLLLNEIHSFKQGRIFQSSQSIIDTYKVQMEYFMSLVKQKKRTSSNDILSAFKVLQIALNETT